MYGIESSKQVSLNGREQFAWVIDTCVNFRIKEDSLGRSKEEANDANIAQ